MNRFFKFKYRSVVFQAFGDVGTSLRAWINRSTRAMTAMRTPGTTATPVYAGIKASIEIYIELRAKGATFTAQNYITTLDYQ